MDSYQVRLHKTSCTHFEEEGDNDTLVSWDIVNEAFMENGR